MTYDLDNPEHQAKVIRHYLEMTAKDFDDFYETVSATMFMLETARELRKGDKDKGQ